ncbi:MAG: acetyl-coenzyme A synthetase N-terminal domain-containing protein, partial [Nitrososphaera sp.]
MSERFTFVPSANLMSKSNISRFMKKHSISNWHQLVDKANKDIDWYWNAVNEDLGIEWFQKYDKTYDSRAGIPWTKWFLNGKCNIVVNAIDRHSKNQPDKVAYIFANEQGSRKITYPELEEQVSRFADALQTAVIKRGDVIDIYLPMIQEA